MTNSIKTLSIIIPAYNESRTIFHLLDKLKNLCLINNIKKEIIIINDCSTDKTEEIVQEFISNNPTINIRYFKNDFNKGKGFSVHMGIRNATGEYLIIQDADLEYDPQEFNKLLEPIIHKEIDIVYGSRFKEFNLWRILFSWHALGNKMLTIFFNICTNMNLTDMETCYKLFNTQIIRLIPLKEQRFGFEPEISAKISRLPDIKIGEIPISYHYRKYREGKKIGWKDLVRTIYCILKYGLFRR